MLEFFGHLERLASDLYPWRWLILAIVLVAVAVALHFAYKWGWHLYAWQRRIRFGIIGAPVLALLLFIAWDLGSPLFINKTVEEEFPFAYTSLPPEGVTMAEVETAMAVMAKVDSAAMEAMPAAMMEAAGGPERLKSGMFSDRDRIHKGSGEAILYKAEDGSHLLRLENLNVTNGPDLHVLLSPHPNPDNRDEVKAPGYFSLGPLKGNRGNQNYPIPPDEDAAAIGSVIIYCVPFQVIFTIAPLTEG